MIIYEYIPVFVGSKKPTNMVLRQ